ncbi:MAG: hypothetical protein ACYC4K_11165 [Thiobacillus sp.]
MNPTKTCLWCKTEKPLPEFVKNARSKGGYMAHCKECNRKKYYLKQKIAHVPYAEAEPRLTITGNRTVHRCSWTEINGNRGTGQRVAANHGCFASSEMV